MYKKYVRKVVCAYCVWNVLWSLDWSGQSHFQSKCLFIPYYNVKEWWKQMLKQCQMTKVTPSTLYQKPTPKDITIVYLKTYFPKQIAVERLHV